MRLTHEKTRKGIVNYAIKQAEILNKTSWLIQGATFPIYTLSGTGLLTLPRDVPSGQRSGAKQPSLRTHLPSSDRHLLFLLAVRNAPHSANPTLRTLETRFLSLIGDEIAEAQKEISVIFYKPFFSHIREVYPLFCIPWCNFFWGHFEFRW